MAQESPQHIDWDRIERIALYTSLALVIVLESVTAIVPAVDQFLPSRSPIILLAAALLLAVRHLIKLIEAAKEPEGFVTHSSFSRAFDQLVNHHRNIDELVIFAYTSATWFEHVRLSRITINRLRILLFYDPDLVEKHASGDPRGARFDLENIAASWNGLVTDKQIRTLEIRHIPTAASFYFGLIGGDKGMFGFLWPRAGISGLEPRDAFFAYSRSALSYGLLSQSREWFDAMWEIAHSLTGHA